MTLLQNILAPLLLPPLGLVCLGILAGLLAARGARRAWPGLLAALAGAGVLLLATPLAAGLLVQSLSFAAPPARVAPGAIIILGGDVAEGHEGADVGLLTLERLRAGAALARASGLPILVTGGPISPGQPPLAALMARSLQADFGLAPRWVEPRAADTRQNAVFSAALLRAADVPAALLVTQGWHMQRALDAFARQGFGVQPAPVRQARPQHLAWSALRPRGDHLAESWFAIHEWAGRAFYALRDGPAAAP
ncbi:YdcF family protein [Falsiroseomonas sp.]|uniref:YdcF family protein n=1 Tax=Falsiroseomonas sp. TaxID=2870721 RepID=UPI003F7242CE